MLFMVVDTGSKVVYVAKRDFLEYHLDLILSLLRIPPALEVLNQPSHQYLFGSSLIRKLIEVGDGPAKRTSMIMLQLPSSYGLDRQLCFLDCAERLQSLRIGGYIKLADPAFG